MTHPRHRNPPPAYDHGIEPFDALDAQSDAEQDARIQLVWLGLEAAEDERWVRSVDFR